MVRNFKRTREKFSFSKYADAPNKEELLRKELSIVQSEKVLLQQRMQTVEDYLETLPAKDPSYGLLMAEIKMDQIEIDELSLEEDQIKRYLQ